MLKQSKTNPAFAAEVSQTKGIWKTLITHDEKNLGASICKQNRKKIE